MNDEKFQQRLLEVASQRDDRIVSAPPRDPGKFMSLYVWTKELMKYKADRDVAVEQLVRYQREANARLMLCGERDGPYYRRKDGLACNFVVVVREQNDELEVLSYAMHVAAPNGAQPGFLRWEYERERKDGVDAVREPLAHLHPEQDQVRLPAPVLSPRELVATFLGLPPWW